MPATASINLAAIDQNLQGLIEELLDAAARWERSNRRGGRRTRFNRRITIHWGAPDGPRICREAYALDVNGRGIAFVAARPCEEQTYLVLEVPRHGEPLLIPARVVGSTEVIPGIFRISAVFCLMQAADQ